VVSIPERERLDGSAPEFDRSITVSFAFTHPCAPIAEHLLLRLRVNAPPGSSAYNADGLVVDPFVHPDAAQATLTASLRLDSVGPWSFQLLSLLSGREVPIGEPQRFVLKQPIGGREWLQWASSGFASLLIIGNVALFFLRDAHRRRGGWRPMMGLARGCCAGGRSSLAIGRLLNCGFLTSSLHAGTSTRHRPFPSFHSHSGTVVAFFRATLWPPLL
jgi:hypothetical protein